jgi:hypothetical protein
MTMFTPHFYKKMRKGDNRRKNKPHRLAPLRCARSGESKEKMQNNNKTLRSLPKFPKHF